MMSYLYMVEDCVLFLTTRAEASELGLNQYDPNLTLSNSSTGEVYKFPAELVMVGFIKEE